VRISHNVLHTAPNKMASFYGVTHSAAWVCSSEACLVFYPIRN